MERGSIYVVLARDVGDIGNVDSTNKTSAETETYDDDAGLQTTSSLIDSTQITHADTDTYDDDAGLQTTSSLIDSTQITRQDADTYDDDPGCAPLGVPLG